MAATGGYAQAALGGLQAIYGLAQLPKAKAEFERARAAAPSLETPSQFYENYKNAYDSSLAAMQNDAIQANLATSVQALQGAGGRALVGGLTQATAQAQAAQNQMLAQERQMRLAAGQQLAAAEERAIGRKEARSQQQMAYANQAYQAALGNIGGGLGAVGEGLMYGLSDADGSKMKALKEKATGAVGKIKEGAETVSEKLDKGLDYLQERISYERDMMPERIQNFRNQRAIKKQLRTAKVPQQQAVSAPVKSIAGTIPSVESPLQAPNMSDLRRFSGMEQQYPVSTPSSPLEQGYGSLINPQPQPSPFSGYQIPTPVAPNMFDRLSPVGGSAIPLEYRNDQAIKQLEALQKGYNTVTEYNKYFFNGGMMTGGAFNHATNPIDLVQNGQKVGEATGGEYILNPSQAAAVAKQSSYARKLFKKFEKNAKKNK